MGDALYYERVAFSTGLMSLIVDAAVLPLQQEGDWKEPVVSGW